MSKTVLTGVKPTGSVHIANYLGAIRPALEQAQSNSGKSFFFIADYHALTTVHKAETLKENTYDVAASWIAFGLDPTKTTIYKQSQVPEIFELAWVLSCFAGKGLMNRAHAYKAIVQENQAQGRKDLDQGVSVGIYTYPILMASDILAFDSDVVPVGEDQLQHLEIARDIAQRLNHNYGEVLKIPQPLVQKNVAVIPGLDGRKMSKSYNNTIPAFCPTKKLRKLVMKIKTDSTGPDEPKSTEGSLVFDLYKFFAKEDEVAEFEKAFHQGISWGEAKQCLYEKMDQHLSGPREIYEELMADKSKIDSILLEGAEVARAAARTTLERVRKATGIS